MYTLNRKTQYMARARPPPPGGWLEPDMATIQSAQDALQEPGRGHRPLTIKEQQQAEKRKRMNPLEAILDEIKHNPSHIEDIIGHRNWPYEFEGRMYHVTLRQLKAYGATFPTIPPGSALTDKKRRDMVIHLTAIARKIHRGEPPEAGNDRDPYASDKHGGRRHRQKIMMGRMN
jgi:hypothetical protein